MRLTKRGQIWHARFYDAAGRRQSASTHCHDKAAAAGVARRFEREASDPDLARASGATFVGALSAMLLAFDELVTAGKKASDTFEFYRKRSAHLLRAHDVGIFPSALKMLRAHHLDEYISGRRLEKVSESTIYKELVTLRKTLKLAKRSGLWKGDIDEIIPTFNGESKPRERALTFGEVPALIRELAAKRGARVAFAIALGADPRDCERALRSDIGETSVRLRGTKNELRDRIVPIVRPWQRQLLDFALEHADGEKDQLFADIWLKSVRDLGLACDAIGIPRVNNKDLRRTFATWLRAEGAAPADIGVAMGHKDSRMVERVYGRLSAADLANRLSISTAVPPVRHSQRDSAQTAHSSRYEDPSKSAESGSDCRTRTYDPVINSHLLMLRKPRETRRMVKEGGQVDPPVRQQKRRKA